MTHDHHKTAPGKGYPSEAELSETYRILEGFDTLDDSAETASILTVSDVIRAATKPADSFQKDTLFNLCALFCTLFVGGMTLGLGISQLSQITAQLTHELPLHRTETSWPTDSF